MCAGTQIQTQTLSAIDWNNPDPMEVGSREKLPLATYHREILAMVNFCFCKSKALFDFADAECT